MPLPIRSEEHTSELQSHSHLVCRLLLEKKTARVALAVLDDAAAADRAGAEVVPLYFLFFFNDTATTEIYTLPLHDALPIYSSHTLISYAVFCLRDESVTGVDRKSTRLNSRHTLISYAV